jgi:hypothetical protein
MTYQITQANADTGETFTAEAETVAEALAQVVASGQASTQHRAEDAAWLDALTESLFLSGEAERGFARYSVSRAL